MAEAIGLAASLINVIELSATICSLCFQYIKAVRDAQDDIARLERETRALKTVLEHVQQLLINPHGAELAASRKLLDEISSCLNQLTKLKTELEPRRVRKVVNRVGIRYLKWPFNKKEAETVVREIRKCRTMLFLGLQIDQTALISYVHHWAVIGNLCIAEGAAFDSHDEEHQDRCDPGTRAELLQQIYGWAASSDGESIFWLNGMAGTGKSTVSRTVSYNWAERGELGASFFFKRGEGNRGHAALFFTTIAAQLVHTHPSLAPHIREAIKANPTTAVKTMKDQFEKLILQPIAKLASSQNPLIIIVVDALDECEREEDVRVIIGLLSQANRLKSVRLKFFVTSRPELPIRLGFTDIKGNYMDLVLHEIPETIIERDISAFLKQRLAKVREEYNSLAPKDRQLSSDWPGQKNIQVLVHMAIPLFVFAATVCRFIKDRKHGDPDQQLAKVLKYRTKSQESKLDATYLPVLNQLLAGLTTSEKHEAVEEFVEVIGSIITLAIPLSTESLSRLLGISKRTIDARLDLLHSVLNVPSDLDTPVRLFHPSFRDFLLDPEKRDGLEKNVFWIDGKSTHQKLATQCIRLMSTNNNLKRDLCNLKVPGKLRAEVDKETLKACLPSHLQYACLYWCHHLKGSMCKIRDGDQAHTFLNNHFLHWLEVLSLIGKIPESIGIIDELHGLVDKTGGSEVSAFLLDAARFILNNRTAIDLTPLQIYSSAILFSPERSVVRSIFKDQIPGSISVLPKVDSTWSPCQQILEGHDGPIKSIIFAHDAMRLASASEDRTIKIWDAATGTCIRTLHGHNGPVNSVVFSPDNTKLASASNDRTVKIWSATTGEVLVELNGHSNRVSSVAFSHDGIQLVSTSGDNTIKIWDTVSGICQITLEGHHGPVNMGAFSHDGTRVVSASGDKTVKIWDSGSGALLQTLDGHRGNVRSVAFSHDSKRVASASYDYTIKIWSVDTGVCQQTLEGHTNWVISVVFFTDDTRLASASFDQTVRIWDATTGVPTQTLRGHSGPVTSATVSSNSKQIASASYDGTIKTWDVSTSTYGKELEGHNNCVNSLVFSPDGTQLASASDDRTIKIWDTTTGSCTKTLEGHNDYVNAVVFSPNGTQLSSCSDDRTIKLWNIASGICTLNLKGHRSTINMTAYSHDGTQLVSASDDRTIKIWNAATGICTHTLQGHSSPVSSAVFSPDNTRIASASDDRTIKIWNTTTGVCMQTLNGHSTHVNSVAFSPDGTRLASASDDRTIKVWNVATSTCIRTVDVDVALHDISFDITGTCIHTEIGATSLSLSSNSDTSTATGRRNFDYCGYGFSIDRTWITRDGENLLWLPSTYRPWRSAIAGSTVAIGSPSGGVFIITFSGGSPEKASATSHYVVRLNQAVYRTKTEEIENAWNSEGLSLIPPV